MQDIFVEAGTCYRLQCFMSELGQPAQPEWHFTKASADNRLHILLIITRRMTTQRPLSLPTIYRQSATEIIFVKRQLICQEA